MFAALKALPLGAKVVGGAATLIGGYWLFKGKPKLQSLRRVSSTGVPTQVVVPVPKSGIAVLGKSAAPIPPNNGSSAVFVPQGPGGGAGQLATTSPIVITPGGAANLAVRTVADLQRALNTLGCQPPLATDNVIGPLTTAAIRAFEAKSGIPVDGALSPLLISTVQKALAGTAGTGAGIGQSFTVQAASASPIAGQALASAGMNGDLFGFCGADGPDPDHVRRWQEILNLLGASPPLKEDGLMNPETVAATQAFQVSYGLVSDGVPGPKTQTAAAIAVSPAAQTALAPSLPKAADHTAAVAAASPPAVAPVLASAAGNLAAAATNPTPTTAQTAAGTVAAQTATAAASTPPSVAPHLAAASNAVASAAAAPDPATASAALATAAASLSAAAQGCVGTACGPATAASLTAAADHLAVAATTAEPTKQADSLQSAANHVANAVAGVSAPAITPPSAAAVPAATPAAAVGGEWDNTAGGFGADSYANMGDRPGGFGADSYANMNDSNKVGGFGFGYDHRGGRGWGAARKYGYRPSPLDRRRYTPDYRGGYGSPYGTPMPYGSYGAPPPEDPDTVPWQDPNAGDATVQDPSIDARYTADGADVGADRKDFSRFHLGTPAAPPPKDFSAFHLGTPVAAPVPAAVAPSNPYAAQAAAEWARYWANRQASLGPQGYPGGYPGGTEGHRRWWHRWWGGGRQVDTDVPTTEDPNVNAWQDPNAGDSAVQDPSLDSYVAPTQDLGSE